MSFNDRLNKSLDELCNGLRDDMEIQLDVKEELRSHIEQSVMVYEEEEGLSQEEAETAAMKDFGSMVEVAEGGELSDLRPAAAAKPSSSASGDAVNAVLAGNIFKVHVSPGQTIAEGEPLLVVEAMKMETVISAPRTGTVTDVFVAEGDAVAVGDQLVIID